MNQHSSLTPSGGSLIERAADLYGFGAAARASSVTPAARVASPDPFFPESSDDEADADPFFAEPTADQPEREAFSPEARDDVTTEPTQAARSFARRQGVVDRDSLRDGGFMLPEAPVSALAEEFRIIKRQLLQAASGKTGISEDKRQTILVCSARPDDGKTFCAVNLAVSMASEKDVEVLLVDGDFSKPEILSILGIEGGPGLIDAIADPASDPEAFVIQTDIERLSVLPAGRQSNNVTELLASRRTRQVLDALTTRHPKRLVIFDSPPTLVASPATILASKVGQIVMVVRADKTKESDLREAVGLLSGCAHLSLILNGAGFATNSRRFGSYYGYGQ